MGSFDWMFNTNTSTPSTISSSSASATPDWYNDFIKGIAGKGMELANQGQSNPIPQQEIAGFTPDQLAAFQKIRNQQGSWQPGLNKAGGQIDAATAAVAGPSANFTQKWQDYMSPYTSSVVDEIARQGNKNFNDVIMPSINGTMIGAGQFGSTRNADVLGRAAQDVQADISGKQAQALESGYAQAGTLFNADANREQAQKQLQATTNLQGAQQTGALTQMGSALGLGDAQALQAVGQQQQQLNQAGLDTGYNNLVTANNAGWNNLDMLNSIIRGVQLPTSTTSTTTGALSRQNGTSPLGALGALYGQISS